MKSEVISLLESGSNVFLTGGAGVGKTTITQEVIKHYESEAKKVAKLASTAMAATLVGGQTLHSFFDFGIASSLEELEKNGKLEPKKKLKKLISTLDLIVVDEISMVSSALMEMVAYRLEQCEFEGSILVVGDFLQLPPVVRGSQRAEFAFESPSWDELDFKVVELTHIYRTDDQQFIELLQHVRFGYVDEDVHNELNHYIKPLPNELNNFTFLFGKNISASEHNKKQLENIEGELYSKEAQIIKHKTSVNDKEIERFFDDARIEKELDLKINAPVLFTRNSWNYYNGERGVIVNIDEQYLYVQKSDGRVVKLETVAQSKSQWVEKTINGKKEMIEESSFSIYQYPVKLAFAITIHKSQGMSIENLIIDTRQIFAPSQFYVALSRSSNPNNLILIAPNTQWYNLAFVDSKALAFVKQGSKC
ncbi:ATP-dependent DNA helicase [Sulfurimonas microaerophilic]|uniref:ATP-dependent DNA helicase n=1 Tax=Sulfurimonas microaerophilic TaxID=3058392 RepID=UPI0027154B76|nr:AAA family ATPase [Sulfurimonas sp. hsl 1-7]